MSDRIIPRELEMAKGTIDHEFYTAEKYLDKEHHYEFEDKGIKYQIVKTETGDYVLSEVRQEVK